MLFVGAWSARRMAALNSPFSTGRSTRVTALLPARMRPIPLTARIRGAVLPNSALEVPGSFRLQAAGYELLLPTACYCATGTRVPFNRAQNIAL